MIRLFHLEFTIWWLRLFLVINKQYKRIDFVPTPDKVDMPVADMPQLGFGTWQIPQNVTKEMVLEALNKGYTHIDCAHVYENEV